MQTSTVKNPHPLLTANFFSKLFFYWLLPLLSYGKENKIEAKDLYEVLPEFHSKTLADTLEINWNNEVTYTNRKNKKPSLLKVLLKTYKWIVIKGGIYVLLNILAKIMQPITLGMLILHFTENKHSNIYIEIAYISGIVIAIILDIIFLQLLIHVMTIGSLCTKISCSSLIYRKIVKLPNQTIQTLTGGKIINILSNDMSKFELTMVFSQFVWAGIIQTLIVYYILWYNVGVYAASVCIGSVVFVSILLKMFTGKVILNLRQRNNLKTDEKISLLTEVVKGIKIIKMYAWDKPFEEFVNQTRKHEIDIMKKSIQIRNMLWDLRVFIQRAILFITLFIYVYNGNNITTYIMFTIMTYINMLNVTWNILTVRVFELGAEFIVSIKRIQNILLLQELAPIPVVTEINDDSMISISDVNVSWTHNLNDKCLSNINLSMTRKRLYTVVGPVGAGKSSFIKLLLGELKPMTGRMKIHGHIAYVSQEPWLFSDTIKSNILFGDPYDETKYRKVIEVCSLLDDFVQFPDGDETVIGDRGASLSGGQCARINLARAVYKNADVYIFDDPLSAVDYKVGKNIFNDCINDYLKEKTRILITHQLQYLKEADEIIVLNKGHIEFYGDFEKLVQTNKFSQYLHSDNSDTDSILSGTSTHADLLTKLDIDEDTSGISDEGQANEFHKTIKNKEKVHLKNATKTTEEQNELKIEKLPKKEPMYIMLLHYLRSGNGICLMITTILISLVAQLFCSASDYWMAFWAQTQKVQDENVHLSDSQIFEAYEYNFAYGGLIAAVLIFSSLKTIFLSKIFINTSIKIHTDMVSSLFGSNIQFFNKNNPGEILNRFSKDIGIVDGMIPMSIAECIYHFSTLLGVIFIVTIINLWLCILFIVFLFLCMKLRYIFLKSIRQLQRLEGNGKLMLIPYYLFHNMFEELKTKSPVFYHVNSSLTGIMTIRSCRAQSMACRVFDALQDNHTASNSLITYLRLGFGIWIDTLVVILITLVSYSVVIFKTANTHPATVGLVISQISLLTGAFQRFMKVFAELDIYMISYERSQQYTQLEQEEVADPSEDAPKSWPTSGRIDFRNLNLRYSENSEPVLKDLNFVVQSGEKIGIVGRTGAGKSSLVASLFRLAKIEGSLLIDNIDIKNIKLKNLREKISILPQEPVIFPASLRKNLDPLDEFDDVAIWSALEDVRLKTNFETLDCVLDQNNLSAGQRQLLCLARVLLKNNKILILDEATASVDSSTDLLIKNTIRSKFKDCTVLTIAHRLNTVINSDKILVMHFGNVVEYDNPYTLLQHKSSYFYKMVEQADKGMIALLKKSAEQASEQKLDLHETTYL